MDDRMFGKKSDQTYLFEDDQLEMTSDKTIWLKRHFTAISLILIFPN